MDERKPDFEDGKIRTWLRGPEIDHWEGIENDPTVITIDEETEEIYESRTYRLKPGFPTFGVVMRLFLEKQKDHPHQAAPDGVAHSATDTIHSTTVKFMSKRRRADGRLTYVLAVVDRGRRSLIRRGELVQEQKYSDTVREWEQTPLCSALPSSTAVMGVEEWRRYPARAPLSRAVSHGENQPTQPAPIP